MSDKNFYDLFGKKCIAIRELSEMPCDIDEENINHMYVGFQEEYDKLFFNHFFHFYTHKKARYDGLLALKVEYALDPKALFWISGWYWKIMIDHQFSTNYQYNKQKTGKSVIELRLELTFLKKDNLHANIIFIDHLNETIEYFEPNGLDQPWTEKLVDFLKDYFKENYEKYTFIHPSEKTCPYIGPQAITGDSLCRNWATLYAFLRIACSRLHPFSLREQMDNLGKKQLLKLIYGWTCFKSAYSDRHYFSEIKHWERLKRSDKKDINPNVIKLIDKYLDKFDYDKAGKLIMKHAPRFVIPEKKQSFLDKVLNKKTANYIRSFFDKKEEEEEDVTTKIQKSIAKQQTKQKAQEALEKSLDVVQSSFNEGTKRQEDIHFNTVLNKLMEPRS